MEGARRLLLVVCLAVVCGAGVMSFGCEPDCVDKPLYAMVTNPRNCSEFYVCDGQGHHAQSPLPCPEGNGFPDGAETCLGGPCTNLCNQEECRYACDTTQTTDVIPSMYNCSEYYACLPGGTYLYECPPELPYFDGVHCIVNSNECCDNPCSPYCSPNTLQTYDPNDCTKYYICLGPGPANENTHVTCPAGQHFEVHASRCIDGTECNNVCQDGNINWPSSTPKPTATPGPGTPTPTGPGTPTPTIPITDCINSLVCPGAGYFSMCIYTCQPQYFECSAYGATGTILTCGGDLVFNSDPDYPYCVLPGNCPYHPPLL